jgi:hypothetical protein
MFCAQATGTTTSFRSLLIIDPHRRVAKPTALLRVVNGLQISGSADLGVKSKQLTWRAFGLLPLPGQAIAR